MKKRRTMTIFKKIFIPLFALMLLQSAIFYLVTVHGSVISTLKSNATDILTERVDNRKNELESTFNTQWVNLSGFSGTLDKLYQAYDAQGGVPLYQDAEAQRQFLENSADTLVSILRQNSVNGAFLILNNAAGYQPLSDTPQSYYGLCIRDYDPNSGYTDREDLSVIRCPSALVGAVNCSLESYWEAWYTFSAEGNQGDFFYKPVQAAYENPGVTGDNLAYFSGPHTYSTGDRPVVSYSLPLIGADGTVYGVLGVELATSYLSGLLPSEELDGRNNGAYMLVQYEEGSPNYRIIASDGVLFQRCFGTAQAFTRPADDSAFFRYAGRQGLDVCCQVSPLTIYNRNTPFETEKLALVGVMEEKELYAVGRQVGNSLLLVTGLVLVIGCIGIFMVSHMLSRPVKRLAQRVRNMKPAADVKLEHINIREIDQLVDAIESQSRKISQSQVRTEFFSRMSHDMRTPMNAIIGFSSPEVLEHADEKQMAEYLDKINNSGKYLLGLINEVLDMTKIDSGQMELSTAPFEAVAFWQGTLPMIEELAALRGIRFVRELPQGEARWVVGDPQRLSQVVVNLLSNAVKFTPKGGTVTLAVRDGPPENGVAPCTISVKDTGCGMSEAFQKKLYQPFEQEHANRDGTGLGLSIAHQLVELMGGSIVCHSALGKGTEFVVSLPLPLAAAPAADAAPGGDAAVPGMLSPAALTQVLAGKRVLLCEDHPMNRQIAGRLLENQKMTVEMAENGRLGVEKFACSEPGYYDVVLMDIRMPVMDGLEAARTIRCQNRPDAKTVPIIAMTANAFVEDVNASAAAGMNAHLAKPIEPQKLYQTLAKFIGERERGAAAPAEKT